MRRSMRFIAAILCAVGAGCAAPARPSGPEALGAAQPDPFAEARAKLSPYGSSASGAAIPVIVLGTGPDVVLFVGSLHGDEPVGTPLLVRLHAELERNPSLLDGRTAILVPKANPDGFASGTRENAAGVDLNRDFPAANRRHATSAHQPETHAIIEVVRRHRPDRVVSIHQPLRCIDFDGDAAELARAMSAASGLPLRKLGARSGSLGSWLGVDQGVPVVTMELPAHADTIEMERLWKRYGEALLIALGGQGST